MKAGFFLALSLFASLSFAISDNPMDESIRYDLNRSRTDFIIRDGSGKAQVVEYKNHEEYGPGYVVSIDYSLKVLLRGEQKGNIGLFVPEEMFNDAFYSTLPENRDMSLGAFNLEYMGEEDAQNSAGTSYPCMKLRIFDIDQNLAGHENKKAKILWCNHEGSITHVTDLELVLHINHDVPVLGAVQIDVTGVSNNGIAFAAGLDARM